MHRHSGIALALTLTTFVLPVFSQNVGPTTSFENSISTLKQLAVLTASDSGGPADSFGWTVAISGTTAVVGAPFAHGGAGAAYVFVKPASGWVSMTQTAELTPSDSAAGINFGISVGISGNTIIIGSFAHNAAYVFAEPLGGWKNMTENAKLSSASSGTGDLFGADVAIDGTTIAVGAYDASSSRGRVDVFVEPSGGWINNTPTGHPTVLAGARNSGTAYIFGP
jgi:FG-GAP repeat